MKTTLQKAGKAELLAELPAWGYVYISVATAGNVRISGDENSLNQNANGGQGPFTNVSPVMPLPWIGQLWAIGDADATEINYDVPGLQGHRRGR